MIKLTHVPEVIYCRLQRIHPAGTVVIDCVNSYEWENQTHKFYDIFLKGDFNITCLVNGVINLHKPGYCPINLYPEDFQEITFR